MDFTEKLILLVQPHPCLYDCRSIDYKNALKKQILWEQISKKLNKSHDTVKNKWKNLKDGYSKYKKNIKGTTGQKKSYVNWVWGPYLSFLDGAIQPRPTTCNVPMISSNTEIATEVNSNSSEVTTETLNNPEDTGANYAEINTSPHNTYDDPSTEESQSLLRSLLAQTFLARKKKQSSNQDHLVNRVLGYIENKENKDPIDILLSSYAKSLKRMKPATQASVKIKLAKIFAEAELQDLQPISVISPLYTMISTASDNDCVESNENVPEDLSSPSFILINNNSNANVCEESIENVPEDLSTFYINS